MNQTLNAAVAAIAKCRNYTEAAKELNDGAVQCPGYKDGKWSEKRLSTYLISNNVRRRKRARGANTRTGNGQDARQAPGNDGISFNIVCMVVEATNPNTAQGKMEMIAATVDIWRKNGGGA